MEIPYSGTLTASQVIKAALIQAKPQKICSLLTGTLAIVILLAIVIDPVRFSSPWRVVIILGFISFFMLAIPIYAAYKQYTTGPFLQREIRGTISDNGIHMKSALGLNDYPWHIILHARIRKEITLLFISKYQYLTLPKNFFTSNDEWQRFADVVKEKVKVK